MNHKPELLTTLYFLSLSSTKRVCLVPGSLVAYSLKFLKVVVSVEQRGLSAETAEP